MPSQKIQKNFAYMFGDFAPVRNKNGRPLHIPSFLDDTVTPTVDAIGTTRWADITSAQHNAPNQTRVFSNIVPVGTIRVVLNASIFHADALNNHILQVSIRNPGGSNVPFAINGVSVPANQHVAVERIMMLGPQFTLIGNSVDATGPGNNLSLRYAFIDIPLGSYLFIP